MKLFLDFTLKRTWGALERFWGRALHFPLRCTPAPPPIFSFFGTKVKLNGEKSCVVVVVLLKGRDRHPKNFRFNFEASLSELEKIPSSISSTFLTYYSGYLEERGQKNKQFYRVYRSLRKWCESLASSLPTPLILLLHYYISNERSIMIFFLDVCSLTLCSSDYCLLYLCTERID